MGGTVVAGGVLGAVVAGTVVWRGWVVVIIGSSVVLQPASRANSRTAMSEMEKTDFFIQIPSS